MRTQGREVEEELVVDASQETEPVHGEGQEWQKQRHAGLQAAVSEGAGSGTEDTVKETARERSRELRDRSFQTGTACLSFSPE